MKITIIAHCGEGKTTVASIIEAALKAHGIIVENNDVDAALGTNVPDMQSNRVKALAGRVVSIETVQLQRGAR